MDDSRLSRKRVFPFVPNRYPIKQENRNTSCNNAIDNTNKKSTKISSISSGILLSKLNSDTECQRFPYPLFYDQWGSVRVKHYWEKSFKKVSCKNLKREKFLFANFRSLDIKSCLDLMWLMVSFITKIWRNWLKKSRFDFFNQNVIGFGLINLDFQIFKIFMSSKLNKAPN